MNKQIPTVIGILTILLFAGVVGASVLLLSQESRKNIAIQENIIKKDKKDLEGSAEKEKEVIYAQDHYESKKYGYKIKIPPYFEYELDYSEEIVKESNFLEENDYGHHDLVIGKERLKTEIPKEKRDLYYPEAPDLHVVNYEFARISLPIKVEDFRQYNIDRGWSGGVDMEGKPYPSVNSIDDWIKHYDMGRYGHGGHWKCEKKIIEKNTVAVCKKRDLAAMPYLYFEYGEYLFITQKGNFIIRSNIITDFGPEPSDWSDTSLHHIIRLEEDTKWLYNEIEKMISSFSFID